jgi:hypothetical protein
MAFEKVAPPPSTASPQSLLLGHHLAEGRLDVLGEFDLDGLPCQITKLADGVWVLLKHRHGGLALRGAVTLGHDVKIAASGQTDGWKEWSLQAPFGRQTMSVRRVGRSSELLRVTVTLHPSQELFFPDLPRDLYPFGDDGTPSQAVGNVRAAQRGLNTALVFFDLHRPKMGSFLYLQNLTALNEFYAAVGQQPDGVVGGHWPEIGYRIPGPAQTPLPPNRDFVVSDCFLAHTPEIGESASARGRLFLELLAPVLLLAKYIRYFQSRAWTYYPSEMPQGTWSEKPRNGFIDPRRAFPVEDLYADGTEAGKIGQEVYGAPAAFAVATRAFHRLRKMPWTVCCEYPLADLAEKRPSGARYSARPSAEPESGSSRAEEDRWERPFCGRPRASRR